MSPQQDKEFLKLQKLWYKKAAASGYEDIEQDEDHLKVWTGHRIKAKYTPEAYLAKQEYYIMAGHFLHEHDFESKTEHIVWGYHSEGLSAPEILEILRKKRKKISLNQIQRMTKKLAREMLKCLTRRT